MLKSAYDAYDGLEFVNLFSLQSPDVVRPAAAWRREIHCGQEGSKMLPGRAAGILQEIVKVMKDVRSDCR